MKELSVVRRPAKAAVMLSMKDRLRSMFDVRSVHISKMSGYPSSLHSIGRLQKLIDTTSFRGLLTSIYKLQQIASVTAEVIDTLEGTKMDRFQLNRTEIITYVNNMVAQYPDLILTTEELDLVANLIVSFEANPANWILQGAEGEDNLHLRFYDLYREVLLADDPGDLAAFSPIDEKITSFGQLDHVKLLVKTKADKEKREVKEGEDKQGNVVFTDACTMYQLAACRVVDHIYQLLLDKDIWYAFVTPRTKADVSTNIARSQSLRLLFTYCQSLLTYYQFFSIEMFLHAYDTVQEWITHFPPLEATVTYELENVIRKHDLLGAQADVKGLMNSFSKNAESDLAAIAFPTEFMAKFGLATAIQDLTDKADQFVFTGDLTAITELNRPQYIPLLAGTSIGALDAIPSMTKLILTHKIVGNEVRQAMTGLVPVLARGSRRSDIEALRSLNLRASMPFVMPSPVTYHVTAGVEKGVEKGVLSLDSLSPSYSFQFHQYLRDTTAFRMKTDRAIAAGFENFYNTNIIDFDKAHELRTIVGTHYRTLIPSQWAAGDRTMASDEIGSSYEKVRLLIEDITGTSYDVFIRELTLPHVQRMFATVISSFACLYVQEGVTELLTLHSDLKSGPDTMEGLTLVQGYGRPYGAMYPSLASAQGELTKETRLVKLGMGAYLRIHRVIPKVIDELRVDPSFYNQRPIMYFTSNSGTMPVDRWLLGDSMLNFSLLPVAEPAVAPKITITPKHVYLLARLYVNYDLYYKPAVAQQAREKTPIEIVTRDWKDDRHQFFLEYRTLGPYSAAPAQEAGDASLLHVATEKIEKIIVESEKEAASSVDNAGQTVKNTIQRAEDDTSQIHAKNTDSAKGSMEHEITI